MPLVSVAVSAYAVFTFCDVAVISKDAYEPSLRVQVTPSGDVAAASPALVT